jgi:hypothetical protein
MRSRLVRISLPLFTGTCCSVAGASQVWQIGFSSGTNGVTQFQTGPNQMIGPAGASNNNQLQITTIDNGSESPYVPSRAGESLGSTVTSSTDSYSGLVDFTWASTNNVTGTSDTEFDWFGFMGSNAPAVTYQTRQISGVALEHWYANGDYYVSMLPEFASVGVTDVAEIRGLPSVDLGPTIPSDMQIAVSWDATTETVHDAFYIGGVDMIDGSANIDNMYGAHPPSYDQPPYPQDEINNQNLTYLGWQDYTGNGNDLETVWEVNSLAYWNDPNGAFGAITGSSSLSWNNLGGTGDGMTWDTTNQNWNNGSGATTYSDGSAVTFNDTNNGNYAVTLNTTVSPASVTFNNSSGNYTLTGTGKIVDAGAFTMSGSDTVTLGVALTAPTVTISSGTVKLASGVSGGTGPSVTSAINLSSLTISGNGVLDIYNNHVIISYGASDPVSTIIGYIQSGYNNGTWNGPGIISSLARTPTNGHAYGIGFADGADKIVSGLSSGQIEVAYTLLGDANLDGVVNGADFSILAANFGQGHTNWDQGNFEFTPAVNGTDFAALAANFGQGDSGAADHASPADFAALDAFAAANGLLADVPEPGSIGLGVLGVMGILARRRHRSTR